MPNRDEQSAPILAALAQLELKLTDLIRAGIAQIQAEHAAAMLEQTKQNASFATRDRVEAIGRVVDTHASEIITLHRQDDLSSAERKDLRAAIDNLAAAIDRRTIGTYDRWLGYLISGGFTVLGAGIAFVLTHAVHP